jgi:hypothetical protein
MNDPEGLAIAIEEAKMSYQEGGVPVSVSCCTLVCHYLILAIDRSSLGLKGWQITWTRAQYEGSERLSHPSRIRSIFASRKKL